MLILPKMGKFGNSNSNKYCSVPQCKSRCTNEISLFRFPNEESLRKKWADAIKVEKGITGHMQVCSRHFVKNDYILSDYPGASKVRRLKKSAVPSQNLPWQFPNKRVNPTLAKSRMERLKNRTQLKTSDTPDSKTEAAKSSDTTEKQEESPKKSETDVVEAKVSTEDVTVDIKLEDDEIEKLKEEAEDEGILKDEEDTSDNDEEPLEAKSEKEDDNKPSRAPTRLRQRKGIIKCEYCGRKCLTPQALQTHQLIAHKNVRNNKKEPPLNKASSPTPVPVALISVKSPESLQENPETKTKRAEKSLNDTDLEKVLQDSDTSDTDDEKEKGVQKHEKRKTEYECPKCKRRFAVFFMAMKHIEKNHSMADNGNQTHLVPMPTRIEICTICSQTLDADVHVCTGPLKLALGFVCTGCEQEYKTLTLFDMHKSSLHCDGVESMFFPTLDEFELWKQKMEIQTGAKYSILDQNDTKTIHRCKHRIVLGSGNYSRQRMCPSAVIVQEFTKGFQVHYYPIHYDHEFTRYGLANAFKKYSITSLMNLAGSKPPDTGDEVQTETDLYLQFKKITDVLVNEAARINVNGLKKLMRKALEMFSIVNSYVEDDDDVPTSNSSIIKLDKDKDDLQEQVKSALTNLKRRPTETIEATLVKRSKSVFQSTENTPKSKGLENVRIANSFSKKDEETENKCDKSPSKLQNQSFIDTFQDFVGKTTERRVKPVKRQIDGKKSAVKTKMGQFKTSPPKKAATYPSPKINASPRTSTGVRDRTSTGVKNGTSTGVKDGTGTGVKNRTNTGLKDRTRIGIKDGTSIGVRDRTSTDVKDGTSTGVKNRTSAGVKDRTSAGVKDRTSAGVKDRTSAGVKDRTSTSVKDIEYEVKEQENDCNILILKI